MKTFIESAAGSLAARLLAQTTTSNTPIGAVFDIFARSTEYVIHILKRDAFARALT
jgi:hypothetical protein